MAKSSQRLSSPSSMPIFATAIQQQSLLTQLTTSRSATPELIVNPATTTHSQRASTTTANSSARSRSTSPPTSEPTATTIRSPHPNTFKPQTHFSGPPTDNAGDHVQQHSLMAYSGPDTATDWEVVGIEDDGEFIPCDNTGGGIDTFVTGPIGPPDPPPTDH